MAVKIEERSNLALFCGKGRLRPYADENGFVLKKAPYFSGAVFLKLIDQRWPGKAVEDFIGSNLIEESEFKKF